MGSSMTRRDLLKVSGSAVLAAGVPAIVKADRPPQRRPNLMERGSPEVYSGEELKYIGMPIGGCFAGTVYLGGDGQLWNWDIFNEGKFGAVDRQNVMYMGESLHAGGGANYVDPQTQKSPFNQRFRLLADVGGWRSVRFGDVRFRGEYPVGKVTYGAGDADVTMELEAFSPFCPLDIDRSSFPATTMTFRVTNVGKQAVKLRLVYQIDNPVLAKSRGTRSDYQLAATKTESGGVMFGAAEQKDDHRVRPPILFQDWSSGTYGDWKATGTAFGQSPQKVDQLPSYMGPVQAGTEYVVNTHQARNGEDVVKADEHLGRLRSPSFPIERRYINLRVGGGNHKDKTCVNLVVDGAVVRSVTGRNSNLMAWESFDVAMYEGKTGYLEVVDEVAGGWGQISLGEVEFADERKSHVQLSALGDFGSFCVEVLGGANRSEVRPETAEIGSDFELKPGESRSLTFVVAWHFPNCAKNMPGKQNWYASQWKDAKAVADDIATNWKNLQATTREWNRTWYDSTLPYWFLDRTFVNTSILATTTCHRLDAGRFYFWEGIGCCAGTCTHVWGYAQAIGRIFPEVERYLRKEIDFGLAYRKETGAIDYRAEYHQVVAHDGQASCILRAYREHQMSKSNDFLRSIWPQVKGAMQYLINEDKDKDGILEGHQYNTLDTPWYGPIAWISSLYIAALRASEAMAKVMGDADFAATCGGLATSGSKKLVSDLFNGEYFVNRADPAHPEANNTNVGCHIDQVYGQSWAHQVGLPRVVPVAETKSALRALYKHSFHEDVWEYRRNMKAIPGGRWYATPKEAGLIMCSFPRGGAAESIGKSGDAWAVGYFNECMSGFEYQVANHMIAEGMLTEGLKIVRAIHDRYHASKRNPYNEIECSDHYGRAMASYGAFVAISGFQIDGPRGTMSHSPKVKGRPFRCAFVNERGWGTVEVASDGKESVTYRHRT
ncbi:MAG: hypothetical protein HONBIEJF_00768 [Fimbriimonadaceae bacterium]|nr:hypothetical protein [Fimbriimonadaceae bacterium]